MISCMLTLLLDFWKWKFTYRMTSKGSSVWGQHTGIPGNGKWPRYPFGRPWSRILAWQECHKMDISLTLQVNGSEMHQGAVCITKGIFNCFPLFARVDCQHLLLSLESSRRNPWKDRHVPATVISELQFLELRL